MTKKDVKEKTVKCDPVKDTARVILCALIASNENEDGLGTIAEAYKLAEAFEAYDN